MVNNYEVEQMKDNLRISIALSSSKEYLKYVQVMLRSLFESNADQCFDIYLVYMGNRKRDLDEIRNIVEKEYGHRFFPLDVPGEIYNVARKDNSKVWNPIVWYRWSIIDLIPMNVERILLLGLDIIVKGSISDFYFQSFEEYWFCMCPDMYMKYSYERSQSIMNAASKRGIDASKEYYNADVVLINLTECRKHICTKSMIEAGIKNSFECMDQDMINYTFHSNIKSCDTFLYNYVPGLKIDMPDYKRRIDDAIIVHYAGVKDKPWKKFCETGPNQLWWYYAKKTAYYEQMRKEAIRYTKKMKRGGFRHKLKTCLRRRKG